MIANNSFQPEGFKTFGFESNTAYGDVEDATLWILKKRCQASVERDADVRDKTNLFVHWTP